MASVDAAFVIDDTGNVAQLPLSQPEEAPIKPVAPPEPPLEPVPAALAQLTKATNSADIQSSASELAALVQSLGIAVLDAHQVPAALAAQADNKASIPACEGALTAIHALSEQLGRQFEPFALPLLPKVFDLLGHKSPAVRKAAEAAGSSVLANICPHSIKLVLPYLYDGIEHPDWRSKEGTLKLLGSLATQAPKQLSACLPDIVPRLTVPLWDTKAQVSKAASEAMTEVCGMVQNPDIKPLVPVVVKALKNPTKETLPATDRLLATTFVTTVDSPTLSIIVPILVRALQARESLLKRKAALVVDNMCKLVLDPRDMAPFVGVLRPELERAVKEVAIQEIREFAAVALETLNRAAGEGFELDAKAAPPPLSEDELVATISGIIAEKCAGASWSGELTHYPSVLRHCAKLCFNNIAVENVDVAVWEECLAPYVVSFVSEAQGKEIAAAVLERCQEKMAEAKAATAQPEEEGVDVCNVEFSLAYGGKVLLQTARLWLKRGRRYGLVGANGVGKSTLMRAISTGQLEGFPTDLNTVYVAHDLDGSHMETSVVDFIAAEPKLAGTERAEIVRVLEGMGFTEELRQASIESLSGGWRMKLALARTMLMNADILLLDEPTNHLDKEKVAWLVNWLQNLKDVTVLVVSHDSTFLDNVCTDIIHYEHRKLVRYPGNLSAFVAKKPEARSYYELQSSTGLKYTFPVPGFLEGVKTTTKAIVKMNNVTFQYPSAKRPNLTNVSVQASLGSRVACTGPNGAGKSTLIKLLVGELEPKEGEGLVWRHPNLRLAYVAQHAFHHVEQHLDSSPVEYIQWRFSGGLDKEGQAKQSLQVDETKLVKKKGQVEAVLGRRQFHGGYEYEVRWYGLLDDDNTWVKRDELTAMGTEVQKMVQAIDERIASETGGVAARQTTTREIQKHLDNFGLESEFGTYGKIAGLSGGQKVKVVLGAAMWNAPHLLVLDEPTNYLDRESLAALSEAIKEFQGGVIVISHHNEFTSALCPEVWSVDNGVCTVTGSEWMEAAERAAKMKRDKEALLGAAFKEQKFDAFGNLVDESKAKKEKLSRKDKMKKKKMKKAGLGGESDDDE